MSKPQGGQPHRFDSEEARENQPKSTGEQKRLTCPRCGRSGISRCTSKTGGVAMSDDDAFSTTVKLQRGTSTDDRDTLKTTVSAPDVETLNDRVEAVKAHMESWADDLRDVQPETSRRTSEDQTDLRSVEA